MLEKSCCEFEDCPCQQKFLIAMIHDIFGKSSTCFRTSPTWQQYFQHSVELYKKQLGIPWSKIKNLKGLSKTRWIECHQA